LQKQAWQVAAVGRDVERLADVDADLRTAADITPPGGAASSLSGYWLADVF
jgi:hypothetical protein